MLIQILLMIFLSANSLSMASGDNWKKEKYQIPSYKAKAIHLDHYYIFSLYKGENKTFIADSLKLYQIHDIVSKESNVWWIEGAFIVNKEVKDKGDIWLYIHSNINAYEIYLNRKLFIKNGELGSSNKKEVSGNNIVHKLIDQIRLVDGVNRSENKILIKYSNYKYQSGSLFKELVVTPYKLVFNRSVTWVYAPLILCGFFILAFGLNISFYFALNKQTAFILLAVFFAVNFLDVFEDIVVFTSRPTIESLNTYFFGDVLKYPVYSLLTIILLFDFQLNRNRILLVFLAVLTIILMIIAPLKLRDSYIITFVPFVVSAYAVFLKKENSHAIFFSLLSLVILTYLDDYNTLEDMEILEQNLVIKSIVYYFDTMGIMIFAFAMVYRSSIRIFKQQKALAATKLKSARLENELLQKHISPHFIMNSLMSLQELIDVDTEKASEMIDSLSEEFHLLATMSKEKLIPINEEIEICRAHLKIMALQQRSTYKFELEGIEGDEMIPPAIIHTLVENGLTHGYKGRETGYFSLSKIIKENKIIYTLFNDSKVNVKNKTNGSKTGLNYIRARLEESYPGKWDLSSHAVENGWKARIIIERIT